MALWGEIEEGKSMGGNISCGQTSTSGMDSTLSLMTSRGNLLASAPRLQGMSMHVGKPQHSAEQSKDVHHPTR
jgi:hypothetical protein